MASNRARLADIIVQVETLLKRGSDVDAEEIEKIVSHGDSLPFATSHGQ